MKKIIVLLIITFSILWLGVLAYNSRKNQNNPQEVDSTKNNQKFIAKKYYQCKSGKQIEAYYYDGPVIASKPGEPPVPSGNVNIILSDGRNTTLKQTISGSGIRYATGDESMVFWSKGETAFITEGETETFIDCTERIWTLGNKEVDEAVEKFLLSQKELSWKTEADSTNFCIYQNLAPKSELFPHYLWVRCGEYKKEKSEIKELSGTSVPVKVDYPNELSFYDLNKFSISIPRDGSLYDNDVKEIFPPEVQPALNFESGPLNEKIKQKAGEYFGL